MTATLGRLRFITFSGDETRRFREKNSSLEFTKATLRIAAVGLTIIGILSCSLTIIVPTLLISYLAMEFSTITSNYQKALYDYSIELTLTSLSPDGHNRDLMKNAPLVQSIFTIIYPLLARYNNVT